MNKKMNKVCIDCVNANGHLIGTEFKINVEFGTCDCCGKRHVIVPFGRFFADNTVLTPCNEKVEQKLEDGSAAVVQKCVDSELKNSIEKLETEMEEHLKLIRELQNKVGEIYAKSLLHVEAPVEELKVEVKDKNKDDDMFD